MTAVGTNPPDLKFGVKMLFSCGTTDDLKLEGNFNQKSRVFSVKVSSQLVCKRRLSNGKMVLHRFRFLYALSFLALGLYCTLFGAKDLQRTLKAVLAVSAFLFSASLLLVLLFDCSLNRAQRVRGRRLSDGGDRGRLLRVEDVRLPGEVAEPGFQ